MGRQKLGEYIRHINYNKLKGDVDDPDHPHSKLKELGEESMEDVTFEELKDGYAAFEQKVCVKGFPELLSQGWIVALTTLSVLKKLMRHLVEENEELTEPAIGILQHTFMAMVKVGPNSTYCDLMVKLQKTLPIIQLFEKKDLVAIMSSLKVSFKYQRPAGGDDEEGLFATTLRTKLERIFETFSLKQYKLVQRELLDVYIFYHAQMIVLPLTVAHELLRVIRETVRKLKAENPYLHLKDPELLKRDLKMVQELVCCSNFVYDNPLDDATRALSEFIITAAIKDGFLSEVFDNMMDVIQAIYKNAHAVKEGHFILLKFRVYVFKAMEEQDIVPDSKILKSCVNMLLVVFSLPDAVTPDTEMLLVCALECVIMRTKPLKTEDVRQILKIFVPMVQSGRMELVRTVRQVMIAMKEAKSLNWKNHVEEAKQILDAFGKIPKEKLQHDNMYNRDYTLFNYRDEADDYLKILKKGKILPQIQHSLVKYFFDCLHVSTPGKATMAQEASGPDFMNFANEKKLRLEVLQKCEAEIKDPDLPWDDIYYGWALAKILDVVVESYDGDGSEVPPEENKLFMSIFKHIEEDGDSVVEHFYDEEKEDIINNRMRIWRTTMGHYIDLHRETGTMGCVAPIVPSIIRWAKIAVKEKHPDMTFAMFHMLDTITSAATTEFQDILPAIIDLMFLSKKYEELHQLICKLYNTNPSPVHKRIQDFFERLDKLKDKDSASIIYILYIVSGKHPEVFTKPHISQLFGRCKTGTRDEQVSLLMILKNICDNQPSSLVDFFSTLCDPSVFKQSSLEYRSYIIACIGRTDQKLGEAAIDYLMKSILLPDFPTARALLIALNSMIKKYKDYMQAYKQKLQKLEKTSKVSDLRDMAHDMILILEGKSVENIAEGLQQQQEDMVVLDTKVVATVGKVVKIDTKVTELNKDVAGLGEGLDKVVERVDVVEDDIGDAKIKMEELDNKTMTNAPKWSRDLSRIMNATAKNDWRLLASRLGYSNDDIRGWATQHDPCMALLSEWYSTHKTSEASSGVLNALTEMNKTDGAAIVENAMKAAKGVVEDDEFEYPKPPPIFISYQWGIQNSVLLLKQHLNMAGYECWLDIGQMGGGDKLFAKIDNGIRGAKVVICCVTEKYAKSPNCNREVNLSVNLNKPMIPLLMEQMAWPPEGSMGPIFSEYLFIRFFQRPGENTLKKDKRYWPIPKFHELLMQLNYYVVPDQKMVKKEYSKWWTNVAEETALTKTTKSKKQPADKKSSQSDTKVVKADTSPNVFLSYQWGKQPEIRSLYHRLTTLGYTVWMDIHQMGGGDSLYDKIDRGIRGCKAVVSCVTLKYSLSANCRREVSLADALKKPIIPLLLEQMKWPPDGPMSLVFTELLYINFSKNETDQNSWKGDKFNELVEKLGQYIPESSALGSQTVGDKPPKNKEKEVDSKTTTNSDSDKGTKGNNKDPRANNFPNEKKSSDRQEHVKQARPKETDTPPKNKGKDIGLKTTINTDLDERTKSNNKEPRTNARPNEKKGSEKQDHVKQTRPKEADPPPKNKGKDIELKTTINTDLDKGTKSNNNEPRTNTLQNEKKGSEKQDQVKQSKSTGADTSQLNNGTNSEETRTNKINEMKDVVSDNSNRNKISARDTDEIEKKTTELHTSSNQIKGAQPSSAACTVL